jgi:ankyrin repeat protein
MLALALFLGVQSASAFSWPAAPFAAWQQENQDQTLAEAEPPGALPPEEAIERVLEEARDPDATRRLEYYYVRPVGAAAPSGPGAESVGTPKAAVDPSVTWTAYESHSDTLQAIYDQVVGSGAASGQHGGEAVRALYADQAAADNLIRAAIGILDANGASSPKAIKKLIIDGMTVGGETRKVSKEHAALLWMARDMLVRRAIDRVQNRLKAQHGDFRFEVTVLDSGSYGSIGSDIDKTLHLAAWDAADARARLLAAAAQEDEAIVALLAAGADVEARNAMGQNAHAVAEAIGCADCVAALDAAADAPAALVELVDDTFNDALTRRGDLETLCLLLAAGVDPNAPGRYDRPALHEFADGPADDLPLSEAVAVLIAAGADIELTFEGGTPLLVAAASDEPGAARALLENGADVNRQVPADAEYEAGYTALMFAAENGSEEIVEMLLSAGADRTMRDAEGLTAADIAASRDYLSLADRLR